MNKNVHMYVILININDITKIIYYNYNVRGINKTTKFYK